MAKSKRLANAAGNGVGGESPKPVGQGKPKAAPRRSSRPRKAGSTSSDTTVASAPAAKSRSASSAIPGRRQPAAAAVATPAVESPQAEQQPPLSSEATGRTVLRQMPSWMASAIVHALILILLGIYTLAAPERPPELAIVGQTDSDVEEPLEQVEFDQPELEEFEMEEVSLDAVDPGSLSLGEAAMAPAAAPTVDAMGTGTLGEIGELFTSGGSGMREIGGGGSASFFGVQTSGDRFVYVVDNSNSMNKGKFETAVAELIKSVGQLERHHFFYVIFYSDMAYPLFYPQAPDKLVPATDENKQKLVYWLRTVHRCLRTDGEEAMQMAFSMRPDAIFLLGDGAFGDKTVEKTVAMRGAPVTIHTLGFKMSEKAKAGFKQIADTFNGTFRDVEVTPAMVQVAERMKRPKNNSQNGVWGVKLGGKKKKKKK